MTVIRDGRLFRGAKRLPQLKGHDLYSQRWATGEVHIYAYLDADRRVLYVGQSFDLRTRNGAHHQHSDWYPLAAEFRVLWSTADRTEARDAEAKAIRALQPAFNFQHNRSAA